MSSHSKASSPVRWLWPLAAAATLFCAGCTTGPSSPAPQPQTAKEVSLPPLHLAPAVAGFEADYQALEEQYLDTSSVECSTTASILSDYMREAGTLHSARAQNRFLQESQKKCDYRKNYQKALTASIRYRVRLASFLMTDLDDNRAQLRETGLQGIVDLTATELCQAGRSLAQNSGRPINPSASGLCEATPVYGAQYFLYASGLVSRMTAVAAPKGTPAPNAVTTNRQLLPP